MRNDDSFVFQNIDFEVEVQPNEKQTKELVVRVIDRDLGMVGLCLLPLLVCLPFFLSVFLSSCLIQFNSKNFNYPTRGNFGVVMEGS